MEQELISRVEDLFDRTLRTNRIAETTFLDPAEIASAGLFLRKKISVAYLFNGGYPEAERMKLFFLPDYFDEESFPFDDYISAIYIKCPFGSPTHRDYLGALMGLGIKREALGDILVFNGYAYIICSPKVSGFIIDNLKKAGRYGISCSPCTLAEIEAPEPEYDVISGTVASLRTDAVTALAFGISRASAAELIRNGKLSVDHIEETSISRELEEDSLLSLRGFGRAKLASLGGISKKGRQFIELHVFSKR